MLYNENLINKIASIASEILKLDIKNIIFDIYFTKIVCDKGVSINIYCRDNMIKKIVISSKKSENTIVFNNDKLGRLVSPFFINFISNYNFDSELIYSDRREIEFGDLKYNYLGKLSHFKVSSISSYLSFNSKKGLNSYKALYVEKIRTTGFYSVDELPLNFKISDEGLYYLDSLKYYLNKSKNKNLSDDELIEFIINIIQLEANMRDFLKENFFEIATTNAIDEKIKRLKK